MRLFRNSLRFIETFGIFDSPTGGGCDSRDQDNGCKSRMRRSRDGGIDEGWDGTM
jgi:hypothetical protein